MVNGPTSRIIYLGAWVSLIVCIIGVVVLAIGEHAIPGELTIFAGVSAGILGGAHIMPPVSASPTQRIIDDQRDRAAQRIIDDQRDRAAQRIIDDQRDRAAQRQREGRDDG